MANLERIDTGRGIYRVGFVCRYRNVNTYTVESATCKASRVELTDAGTFYRPPEIGEDLALELVREYETRAWLAHLEWCGEKGYEANAEHRHALVPA